MCWSRVASAGWGETCELPSAHRGAGAGGGL